MRLIDADAYAAEMKKRQDACQERIHNPTGNVFTDGEHWGGVFAAFVEAKLTLDAAPTIGGWISVKDRLPDLEEQVLIVYEWTGRSGEKYREIALDSFKAMGFLGYKPLFWMPLPEPPEEMQE